MSKRIENLKKMAIKYREASLEIPAKRCEDLIKVLQSNTMEARGFNPTYTLSCDIGESW